MKTLTENQKQFVISFFEDNRYAGWKNIATTLVETGKCIVPGEECIWQGGIGNFITTKETDLAVGCLEYNFDLDLFLSSAWFKEALGYKVENAQKEKQQKEREYEQSVQKFNELNELL